MHNYRYYSFCILDDIYYKNRKKVKTIDVYDDKLRLNNNKLVECELFLSFTVYKHTKRIVCINSIVPDFMIKKSMGNCSLCIIVKFYAYNLIDIRYYGNLLSYLYVLGKIDNSMFKLD